MRLEIIADEKFIAVQHGKKETLLTPGQAVAAQHRIIDEKELAISTCRKDAASVQQRIEDALLAGEPTRPLRDELVAISEQEDALKEIVGEARDAIHAIWNLCDEHDAAQTRQADKSRLAALIAPYEELLKAYAK